MTLEATYLIMIPGFVEENAKGGEEMTFRQEHTARCNRSKEQGSFTPSSDSCCGFGTA
jgi:hypothetical protein